MKVFIIIFVGVFGLAGCTSMGHQHSDGLGSHPKSDNSQRSYSHDGTIKALPKDIEDKLKELAKVDDIGYVLVVGKHNNRDNMNVLRSRDSRSSRTFNLSKELVPNNGIKRIDSIGVVTYKGSHCVGSSFSYVVGGVLKEICY